MNKNESEAHYGEDQLRDPEDHRMQFPPPYMRASQPHSALLMVSGMQTVNLARCVRWHSASEPWSLLEWAGAMCGEAGEAANIAKKIRRAQLGLVGNGEILALDGAARFLQYMLADEIADTILYASLLASHANIDLADAIVSKFNKKSIEQGFPERL